MVSSVGVLRNIAARPLHRGLMTVDQRRSPCHKYNPGRPVRLEHECYVQLSANTPKQDLEDLAIGFDSSSMIKLTLFVVVLLKAANTQEILPGGLFDFGHEFLRSKFVSPNRAIQLFLCVLIK